MTRTRQAAQAPVPLGTHTRLYRTTSCGKS